jgi:hypothetical protein
MIKGANYLIGDATDPQAEGVRIIGHICNDIGAWGAGFVMALSKKWKEPEAAYRAMETRTLGECQIIAVEEGMYVANMIGQEGIGAGNDMGVPPIRYAAVRVALIRIFQSAMYNFRRRATVHLPEIGCGLAGGDWMIMQAVIQSAMDEVGFPAEDLYLYKFG